MRTCIGVNGEIYMHHTYMCQGHGLELKDHRNLHHGCIDVCIYVAYICDAHIYGACIYGAHCLDTCVFIRYMYDAYILLLESPCPFVGPFVTKFAASYIHAPHIHACFRIKVQDHRYVHHTHMQYSQGSRNIDRCIIHVCIRIKDRGS